MSFKTPKGTTLKILNLKGKDYLPVAERILWFREECKNWRIITTPIKLEPDICVFRAEIFEPGEKGELIATAHKSETPKGFADYIEKAETGAIGRALALCGFGTQFTGDELDEGERLADAPREATQKPYKAPPASSSASVVGEFPKCPECGTKMLPSKFPTGPKFFCPQKKNHKSAAPALFDDDVPPF